MASSCEVIRPLGSHETALNDGVDVITTSAIGTYEGSHAGLWRARLRSRWSPASTTNSTRDSKDWLPAWGGVVGVKRDRATASSRTIRTGEPRVDGGPGAPVRSVSQERGSEWGTSFTAPLVAEFAGTIDGAVARRGGNPDPCRAWHTPVSETAASGTGHTAMALDVYALLDLSMSLPG